MCFAQVVATRLYGKESASLRVVQGDSHRVRADAFFWIIFCCVMDADILRVGADAFLLEIPLNIFQSLHLYSRKSPLILSSIDRISELTPSIGYYLF